MNISNNECYKNEGKRKQVRFPRETRPRPGPKSSTDLEMSAVRSAEVWPPPPASVVTEALVKCSEPWASP